MILETDRLHLIPLTAAQLRLWTQDIPALERELGVVYRGEAVDGPFADIVNGQIPLCERDAVHWLFRSFWLLVRKEDQAVVGSACFKRPPDEKAEVEIGYGLAPQHEGNGYMTEAVKAMCAWALSQPGIAAVIAETEPENPASMRVLTRCGFRLYRDNGSLWWRL